MEYLEANEYVKTDYDGCPYITAGKAYKVIRENTITDDVGDDIHIIRHGCMHIGGHKWNNCDTPAETGTLKELDVKAGDVVEYTKGEAFHMTRGKRHTVVQPQGVVMDHGEWWSGSTGGHESRIISRAEDTPKTWGEMTDAERGALLLAWQRGETLQYWDYDDEEWRDTDIHPHEFDADAYRVKTTPSHLPLAKGKVYELESGQEWECLFVHGCNAWLSYSGNGTAYVFNTHNGKAVSLGGGDYNVKGLVQC